MAETDAFSIEPLTVENVPASLLLCRQAGWNQVEADWKRLIHYEPQGCFAALHNHKVVGTVTTTTYGVKLAWIGMMLVDPAHRRQGVATVLMRKAMSRLQTQGVQSVWLDATPAGELVYQKLGFERAWKFHRWQRKAGSKRIQSQDQASNSTPLSTDLQRLDCIAFGADRSEYVSLLALDSKTVLREGGFGMMRRGFLADYLGPVCAETPEIADQIIGELIDHSQHDLFWDIPSPNHSALQLAEKFGFSSTRTLTRMKSDSASKSGMPGKLQMQFAISGPATG